MDYINFIKNVSWDLLMSFNYIAMDFIDLIKMLSLTSSISFEVTKRKITAKYYYLENYLQFNSKDSSKLFNFKIYFVRLIIIIMEKDVILDYLMASNYFNFIKNYYHYLK